MSCTQHKQLVSFRRARVQKKWFRYFNDHKDFRNEGTLHLFSLMALYSYADFRSNTRSIEGKRYLESPGQWICKVSALPRVLRAHSKAHAMELMDYFKNAGFLDYEMLDEESGILRYSIADWKKHCTYLEYNYYSYKGSGFFFFPRSVGRQMLNAAKNAGKIVFSELDAIMDLWVHTIFNDPSVLGSACMPVVYFTNMGGKPLLSYTYLAHRWGWSKSRVGRFILKIEEAGIIGRVSFSSSRGSVIIPYRFREMIYGDDGEEIKLKLIGEILGIAHAIRPSAALQDIKIEVETRVPKGTAVCKAQKSVRIQVFSVKKTSFFARPTPLIFYSCLDWGDSNTEAGVYRGPPSKKTTGEGEN